MGRQVSCVAEDKKTLDIIRQDEILCVGVRFIGHAL